MPESVPNQNASVGPRDERAELARAYNRTAVALLLIAGCFGTIAGINETPEPPQPQLRDPSAVLFSQYWPTLVCLAIAAALWMIRPIHDRLVAVLDAIRTPGDRARRLATVAIALLSAGYFYGSSAWQGNVLTPVWHDSNQHMVQAQLLLHGRLWTPPHPLADHLETFFVFAKPVYAALHFPGTSLLYAPLLGLGVGPAVFSALMTGATVGLMYRVIAELIDGVAAAMVVPVILATTMVRELSTMLLSHHTFLVPVLLACWAFLRWRRTPGGGHLAWLLALGSFIAYAGIMRPVEALAYAAALGTGIAFTLRRSRPSRWLAAAGLIVLGASPWLGLQLIFDRAVTGSWLLPPYEYYIRLFQPAVSYAAYESNVGAETLPTQMLQKIDYYDGFIHPLRRLYVEDGPLWAFITFRLPVTLMKLAPSPFVYLLWAPALVGFRTLGLRLFAIAAVVFFGMYIPHVFFLPHYPIAILPLAVVLAVLGVRVVGQTFAGGRRSIELAAVLLLVAAAAGQLPEFNRMNRGSALTWAVHNIAATTWIPEDVKKPAAVFFRYRPRDQPYEPRMDSYHDEPVYTIDAVRPEDSPVARFQDLGPRRNREVYAFFAQREPQRNFYLYDRRLRTLVPLGTARELLDRGERPAYFRIRVTTRDFSVVTTQATAASLDVKP